MNGIPQNGFPDLTILTVTPVVAALLLAGFDSSRRGAARIVALGSSFVTLAHALCLWSRFKPDVADLQFVEKHAWISSLGVDYFLGADGLSLLMILLTAIVIPGAIAAAWKIETRAPLYFSLMLFLQAGLFGAFTAQSFFHWFLFWELALIPAFFLIKLWGGMGRGPAAMQFFIYTMVGSVALLLGFLGLYQITGKFNFPDLAEIARKGELAAMINVNPILPSLKNEDAVAMVLFWCVFLGLAVKVPLMPLHGWLPATYSEAPTSTTMVLTGLMSKMGVYGFLRLLLPIFPAQMRAVLDALLILAIITIVLGALAAFGQRDLKRILAYSSISHLGYCLLGIFAASAAAGSANAAVEKAAALNGVLLQMFGHGITAATLFFLVGHLEDGKNERRGIDDFGGLRQAAPILAGLMGIALFASLGLPGLNGFPAEFLIFKGVFPLAKWAAALAAIGLFVTATYILRIIHQVFNGPLCDGRAPVADLKFAERIVVVSAVFIMFALGFFPQVLIRFFNTTVARLVEGLG
jgi:NADH-quinone oxidoreductase subunit M